MGAASDSQERRQHTRWHLASPLSATLGLTTPLRVIDISPVGVRVECGHPLTLNQAGILDVVLPGAEFHLRSRVVWCQLYQVLTEPAGRVIRYRAGLRYADLPAAGGAHLYALVSHLPDPRLPPGGP